MSRADSRRSFTFVFEYRRRYNEMKVEIITEGRLIDIIKHGFDGGVRLAVDA